MHSPAIRPARLDEAEALSALAFASKSHWPYTPAQLALWRDDLRLTEAQAGDGTVWVAELPGGDGDSDPHAEAFYLAQGAVRVEAVAAPVEGQPGRVRPQLLLSLG